MEMVLRAERADKKVYQQALKSFNKWQEEKKVSDNTAETIIQFATDIKGGYPSGKAKAFPVVKRRIRRLISALNDKTINTETIVEALTKLDGTSVTSPIATTATTTGRTRRVRKS